ncbi:unnamed protein product, partial [Urochloa humidicola]
IWPVPSAARRQRALLQGFQIPPRKALREDSWAEEVVEPWGTLASLVLLLHFWERSMIQLSNGRFMASQLYLIGGLYQLILLFLTAVDTVGSCKCVQCTKSLVMRFHMLLFAFR